MIVPGKRSASDSVDKFDASQQSHAVSIVSMIQIAHECQGACMTFDDM